MNTPLQRGTNSGAPLDRAYPFLPMSELPNDIAVSRLQYVVLETKALENLVRLAAGSSLLAGELHCIGDAFALRAKAHRRDIRVGAVSYRRPDEDQFNGKSLIPLDIDLAAKSWGFRLHLLVHARRAYHMARVMNRVVDQQTPEGIAMKAVAEAGHHFLTTAGLRPDLSSPSVAYQFLTDSVHPCPLEMDVMNTRTLILADLFSEEPEANDEA